MPIYVSKNQQQFGPYEDRVVVDQLRSGMLSPNELGIRQGEASWSRLGELFPGIGQAPVLESSDNARAFAGSAGASAIPSQAAAVTSVRPEPQYRKTALQKIFFALCFIGVLSILAACVYYILTFT